MYVPVLLSAGIIEEVELMWVCCRWCVDLFLFSRGCWHKHVICSSSWKYIPEHATNFGTLYVWGAHVPKVRGGLISTVVSMLQTRWAHCTFLSQKQVLIMALYNWNDNTDVRWDVPVGTVPMPWEGNDGLIPCTGRHILFSPCGQDWHYDHSAPIYWVTWFLPHL
jgi:hypothetical protein